MNELRKLKATKLQLAIGMLIIVVISVIAAAAAVAGLVFGAYGCGKLFARWLPFSPFESTVVSLLALVSAGVGATKALYRLSVSIRRDLQHVRCKICGRYHDGVEDEPDGEEENDDEDEDLTPNEGLRAALYASGAVKPNSPCPCGSGQRYSKCCGDGRIFRHARS